jgi:hypothetical protein
VFPSELQPVLKGAVLVGRAYLVRNFPETAFPGAEVTSHGDEVQMIVTTRGILGRGSPSWVPETEVPLTGLLSPTGFGEGYAASDRYRLEGKPLVAGHGREAPSVAPDLALYPYTGIRINAEGE